MSVNIKNAHLYGILDMGYVTPEGLVSKAQQLLEGGCDILQLRAKGCEVKDIKVWALQLKPLCEAANIPFIINDFPDVAKEVGADGLHIGQDDGSLIEVRKIVGNEMLVGRSTHSLPQAKEALKEGFDYIGFGPLYSTPTKPGRPAIGVEDVKTVEVSVGQKIPVFCIGGIKVENLDEVRSFGAKRAVIVSDLLVGDDTIHKTQQAKTLLS